MEVEKSNKLFSRSKYYPFPRDLGFAPEKPALRKYAQGKKSLVEIGVFEGASSILLRKNMARNGELHLIDPFIPDSMNSNLSPRKFFAKMNLARSFNGKIFWHFDYSHNVAKTWVKPLDFLFIDGDHSEEACLEDWRDWHKFIQPGGIVAFHDARFGKGDGSYWDGWEGPTKIVDLFFREKKIPGWEIVDEAGTIVIVRKL